MWKNKTHDLSNLQFYTENEKGERMITVFCRNVKLYINVRLDCAILP